MGNGKYFWDVYMLFTGLGRSVFSGRNCPRSWVPPEAVGRGRYSERGHSFWKIFFQPPTYGIGWEMGNIFGMYICYSPTLVDPYWEKLPEVLSTILGRRPREVLRPRAPFLPIRIDQGRWITFLFFSYWHLKVSGKFYFSLQPINVEVERVRVDEARDRLQTKTKHTTWFLACNLYYHKSALSSFRIKKGFCVLVDNS